MRMMVTMTKKIMWKTIAMMTRSPQDTRTLDPYSSYDFYQSQTTDFYERSGAGADCRDQVSSILPSEMRSGLINPSEQRSGLINPSEMSFRSPSAEMKKDCEAFL